MWHPLTPLVVQEERLGDVRAQAAVTAAGVAAGRRLGERLARGKPRLGRTVDIVKFLCKDAWLALFRKPADKLQKDRMGSETYVVTDANFAPLRALSAPAGVDTRAACLKHLLFPCALLRGVLAAFGADARVLADPTAMPATAITIQFGAQRGAAGAAAAAAAAGEKPRAAGGGGGGGLAAAPPQAASVGRHRGPPVAAAAPPAPAAAEG